MICQHLLIPLLGRTTCIKEEAGRMNHQDLIRDLIGTVKKLVVNGGGKTFVLS